MAKKSSAPPRPKGIQYKRGQPLPENAKLVARPSRWGNPFRTYVGFEASDAVEAYRRYLAREEPYQTWPTKPPPTRAEIQEHLRGFDLACYCAEGEPCHRDILLEIANAATP